jgi:hypothetical protein
MDPFHHVEMLDPNWHSGNPGLTLAEKRAALEELGFGTEYVPFSEIPSIEEAREKANSMSRAIIDAWEASRAQYGAIRAELKPLWLTMTPNDRLKVLKEVLRNNGDKEYKPDLRLLLRSLTDEGLRIGVFEISEQAQEAFSDNRITFLVPQLSMNLFVHHPTLLLDFA